LTDDIFKRGFKDSKGNVLTFSKCGAYTLMNIDGSDCSEGVEERVSDEQCALEAIKWYGYNELADIFDIFINKINSNN